MTEKLILKRQRPASSYGVKPVFIDARILKDVRAIKEETGIPMGRLAEIFIQYAIKHIEVVNEEDGDQ